MSNMTGTIAAEVFDYPIREAVQKRFPGMEPQLVNEYGGNTGLNAYFSFQFEDGSGIVFTTDHYGQEIGIPCDELWEDGGGDTRPMDTHVWDSAGYVSQGYSVDDFNNRHFAA